MRSIAILGLIAMSGCTDKAAEAEKQLKMVERFGATPDELCRRKKAVAEAYLEAGNEDKYLSASINADSSCMDAALMRR